jgi:maltose alpha-D-glucosyltransferase/alpha-amylase
VFLRAYLELVGAAPFLPRDAEEIDVVLNAFLLHKAIYELAQEIAHRPDWIPLPIHGILSVLEARAGAPVLLEIQRAYPGGLPNP